MKKKALFLDRDGILIKMYYHRNSGLIDTPLTISQIEFTPGIFDLLRLAKKLGYLLIIISNQPGIGIKKISKKNYLMIQEYIKEKLITEGIKLDGEYYCFHHSFAEITRYKKGCKCRKPQPTLILKATQDLSIDLKKSIMIGDGIDDIISGFSAGCKTILVANIFEAEYLRILEEKLGKIKPTFLVKNIRQIEKILS